mgnify:CR=1 FL=1
MTSEERKHLEKIQAEHSQGRRETPNEFLTNKWYHYCGFLLAYITASAKKIPAERA